MGGLDNYQRVDTIEVECSWDVVVLLPVQISRSMSVEQFVYSTFGRLQFIFQC